MKPADDDKHAPAEPHGNPVAEPMDSRSPRSGRDTLGRAFVVQVAPDAGPAEGRFRGRVQHLATSDGGNFDSADDLVAIIRRVLGHGPRGGSSLD